MVEQPSIEVVFESTAEDFMAYVDHVATQGEFYRAQMQSARTRLVVILALLVPLVAVTATPDWNPFTMLAATLAGWVLVAVLWAVWPSLWRRQLRGVTKRQVQMENPLVLYGPKRYVLEPSALRYSGHYAGGYVTWPAIMRVTRDERAVYLHVSQGAAHIVPRRAFAADAEFARFAELAEHYRTTAR